MQDIFNIIKEVSGFVTPSNEERLKLDTAVQQVEEHLQAKMIKYEIGGSYARDTWLSGDADVDFFMMYPPDWGADKINQRGLEDAEVILSEFPHWKRFAEHPYLEGIVNGITVNLVPCADTKQGVWITSMDRSRFHTLLLKQMLNEETKKQVRVLKLFLKANGIYGAEIRIGGFSGYVTEILTVKYGSFLEVINGVKGWKRGTVISLLGKPSQTFNTPITILDPVDNSRNLAAAIRPSNIAKFQLLAGKFLETPSLSFFRKKHKKFDRTFASSTVSIVFKAPDKVEEIRWSEYLKSCRAIFNELNFEGFGPITFTIYESNGWVSFTFLVTFKRSHVKIKAGPPAENIKASLEFTKLNKNIFIGDDMKIYSVNKRKLYDVHAVIEHVLKRPVEAGIARGLIYSLKTAKIVNYSKKLNNKEYYSAIKGSLNDIFQSI
ncbi:MAG: CCA tRNA nucleotidyltransferase [Conexivisphaerales archaeon]